MACGGSGGNGDGAVARSYSLEAGPAPRATASQALNHSDTGGATAAVAVESPRPSPLLERIRRRHTASDLALGAQLALTQQSPSSAKLAHGTLYPQAALPPPSASTSPDDAKLSSMPHCGGDSDGEDDVDCDADGDGENDFEFFDDSDGDFADDCDGSDDENGDDVWDSVWVDRSPPAASDDAVAAPSSVQTQLDDFFSQNYAALRPAVATSAPRHRHAAAAAVPPELFGLVGRFLPRRADRVALLSVCTRALIGVAPLVWARPLLVAASPASSAVPPVPARFSLGSLPPLPVASNADPTAALSASVAASTTTTTTAGRDRAFRLFVRTVRESVAHAGPGRLAARVSDLALPARLLASTAPANDEDVVFDAAARCAPSLRRFAAAGPAVTGSAVVQLLRAAPHLERLELAGCSRLEVGFVTDALAGMRRHHAENAAAAASASYTGMLSSPAPAPGDYLAYLDLSYTRTADADLAGLAACLPRLATLRLSGCPAVGDAGLAAVLRACAALTDLHVADCPAVSDAALLPLLPAVVNNAVVSDADASSAAASLRSVCFSATGISPAALPLLLAALTALQSLSLDLHRPSHAPPPPPSPLPPPAALDRLLLVRCAASASAAPAPLSKLDLHVPDVAPHGLHAALVARGRGLRTLRLRGCCLADRTVRLIADFVVLE
ncbi:hypothetical protein HK405_011389, partial [Cladochytrium tenue]